MAVFNCFHLDDYIFAVLSLILLPIPSFRRWKEVILWNRGAVLVGIVSARHLFSRSCSPLHYGCLIRFAWRNSLIELLIKYAILFSILILWVIVLPWGYTSGFRADGDTENSIGIRGHHTNLLTRIIFVIVFRYSQISASSCTGIPSTHYPARQSPSTDFSL